MNHLLIRIYEAIIRMEISLDLAERTLGRIMEIWPKGEDSAFESSAKICWESVARLKTLQKEALSAMRQFASLTIFATGIGSEKGGQTQQ